MAGLLKKIKTKMYLEAYKKAQGVLEGDYGSIFKGRSIDFDDLREYIPGDDVKDIDWKASVRSQQILIKRYIAVRKHNILLVVNTGKNMAATSTNGEDKRELAILAAGLMGFIAQKHGDLVGMVAGDNENTTFFPFRGSSPHLETLLQFIYKHITSDAPSGDIIKQLNYALRNIRRRMIIIVVTDEHELTPEHETALRRINTQHELLWITVGDINLGNELLSTQNARAVDNKEAVFPKFIVENKTLIKEFEQNTSATYEQNQDVFNKVSVANERMVSDADAVEAILRLLEKHSIARGK
jgi:uncharacterized protein (DUF58 family)